MLFVGRVSELVEGLKEKGKDGCHSTQEIIGMELLVTDILKVTNSPESTDFYRHMILKYKEHSIRLLLAELKNQITHGMVKNPAKYFTTMLKKMEEKEGPLGHAESLPQESYFSPTPQDLVAELNAGPVVPNDCNGSPTHNMDKPYSGKAIPWTTFVSSDFFTLSTNKNKSDRVLATFHTMDGQVVRIQMIRGRNFPGDDERGILTVEHGRILGALEMLWAKQNTFFKNLEKKIQICYCDIRIRDIARLLGAKTFGGSALLNLKKKIIDLSVMPFYLDTSDAPDAAIKMRGYGFAFLGSVTTKIRTFLVAIRLSYPIF